MNADLVKALSDLTEPCSENRPEAEAVLHSVKHEDGSPFRYLCPELDWAECPSTGPWEYGPLFEVVELASDRQTYWLAFDMERREAFVFTTEDIPAFAAAAAEVHRAYLLEEWGEEWVRLWEKGASDDE